MVTRSPGPLVPGLWGAHHHFRQIIWGARALPKNSPPLLQAVHTPCMLASPHHFFLELIVRACLLRASISQSSTQELDAKRRIISSSRICKWIVPTPFLSLKPCVLASPSSSMWAPCNRTNHGMTIHLQVIIQSSFVCKWGAAPPNPRLPIIRYLQTGGSRTAPSALLQSRACLRHMAACEHSVRQKELIFQSSFVCKGVVPSHSLSAS